VSGDAVKPLPPTPLVPTLLERAAHAASGRVNRGRFAFVLLPHWGVERVRRHGRSVIHPNDVLSMMSWAQAEGQAGRFNLLNCTQVEAGSWDFNGVHVQNYSDFGTSQKAHAHTLNYGANHDEHGYGEIRHALRRHASPSVVAAAVEASAWGTGGLMSRVYEQTPNATLFKYRYVLMVQ
jgi:hypothetical protein